MNSTIGILLHKVVFLPLMLRHFTAIVLCLLQCLCKRTRRPAPTHALRFMIVLLYFVILQPMTLRCAYWHPTASLTFTLCQLVSFCAWQVCLGVLVCDGKCDLWDPEPVDLHISPCAAQSHEDPAAPLAIPIYVALFMGACKHICTYTHDIIDIRGSLLRCDN